MPGLQSACPVGPAGARVIYICLTLMLIILAADWSSEPRERSETAPPLKYKSDTSRAVSLSAIFVICFIAILYRSVARRSHPGAGARRL